MQMTFNTFTGGDTNTPDGSRVVEIELRTADLNELKLRDFATNTSNTYLSIKKGSTKDMALNELIEIKSTNGKKAHDFTKDETEPKLEKFEIDINDGTIELLFNEPIKLSDVDFSKLVISAGPSADSTNITLQPGKVAKGSNDLSKSVILTLHQDDIAEIKLDDQFATKINNSYITIKEDGIFDAAGIGINQTGPVMASVFLI